MENAPPTLIETLLEDGIHSQPLQFPKKMILLSMILSKFSAVIDTLDRANCSGIQLLLVVAKKYNYHYYYENCEYTRNAF